LDRWGVITRDVIRAESAQLAWRDLLVCLRRLEAQGEIRGGRFVASHIGEQFASREAIDLLRSVRRRFAPAQPSEDAAAMRAEAAARQDELSMQRRAG